MEATVAAAGAKSGAAVGGLGVLVALVALLGPPPPQPDSKNIEASSEMIHVLPHALKDVFAFFNRRELILWAGERVGNEAMSECFPAAAI